VAGARIFCSMLLLHSAFSFSAFLELGKGPSTAPAARRSASRSAQDDFDRLRMTSTSSERQGKFRATKGVMTTERCQDDKIAQDAAGGGGTNYFTKRAGFQRVDWKVIFVTFWD
jgi:hypothetical protein